MIFFSSNSCTFLICKNIYEILLTYFKFLNTFLKFGNFLNTWKLLPKFINKGFRICEQFFNSLTFSKTMDISKFLNNFWIFLSLRTFSKFMNSFEMCWHFLCLWTFFFQFGQFFLSANIFLIIEHFLNSWIFLEFANTVQFLK